MTVKVIRKLLLIPAILFSLAAQAQYVTLTGNIQSSNGLPASNFTLSFQPSQWFFVAGTGVAVNTTTNCATSTDGSVVGIGNPLQPTIVSPQFSGTLSPGTYYVEYTFYAAAGETLPSPEIGAQLTSTGQLTVAAPTSGIPAGALGMRVYMGSSSGSETLQGASVGSASFVQSVPLTAGSALPSVNTTSCKQIANDAGWPTGTGYKVALSDSAGNTIPGYPMMWQLLGPNTTINLLNGLPYYHGVVTYPVPILASPLNHVTQSISGGLSFGGYNVLNAGKIGVGTSTPAWPLDVENGLINSSQGYLYNGGAGVSGNCLVSNGTAFIPGNCTTGTPIYYQAMFTNDALVPQRDGMNFLSTFVLSDSGYTTGVDLAPSGVSPGTYTNPTITVDSYGRVDASSNGVAPPIQRDIIITSGICTTPGTSYGQCTTSPFSWPSGGFADTNYTLTCQGFNPTGDAITGLFATNKMASGFQLTLQNGTSDGAHAATFGEVDCHGSHL